MILSVVHTGNYRGTITKIKNDFDNPFRNDMFLMKRSQAIGLPDGAAVFTQEISGLMVEASVGGQKFSYKSF